MKNNLKMTIRKLWNMPRSAKASEEAARAKIRTTGFILKMVASIN